MSLDVEDEEKVFVTGLERPANTHGPLRTIMSQVTSHFKTLLSCKAVLKANQTDRQADGQTGRQTDRQTETDRDGQR